MLKPLATLISAFLVAGSSALADTTASLTVEVDQLDPDKGGKLVVMVYNSKNTWLQIDKNQHQVILDVTGTQMTVTFDDVPFGTYAVSAVQDLNGNNKVDMSWVPVPRPSEPLGISNNIQAKAGPPSFDKASFPLDTVNKSLSITLEQ